MTDQPHNPFARMTNLADARLGAEAIHCTDDFFADMHAGCAGGTVHVTKTVRRPDGSVHKTSYTTSAPGSTRAGVGPARHPRGITSDARPPAGGMRRSTQGGLDSYAGHSAVHRQREDEQQLAADLTEAMRVSQDDLAEEEARMLQAAINASLGM